MHSLVYKKFKKEIGQANHFLITILVGLDAVEDGAQKRADFHTSWAPQDNVASAQRSRKYAIKAALAWTVDNLDMYFRLANQSPCLYCDEESQEIAETKHSVYNKLQCVINNHPEIDPSLYAYVDMLICWRNNTTHFGADNELLHASRQYFSKVISGKLTDNKAEKYHLDIAEMLNHFNSAECPSFKEITTLISITIKFVEILDTLLINNIDQSQYLRKMLVQLVKHEPAIASIFSRRNSTHEIRVKKLKQVLASAGICDDFYNDDGTAFLNVVAEMTVEDLLN